MAHMTLVSSYKKFIFIRVVCYFVKKIIRSDPYNRRLFKTVKNKDLSQPMMNDKRDQNLKVRKFQKYSFLFLPKTNQNPFLILPYLPGQNWESICSIFWKKSELGNLIWDFLTFIRSPNLIKWNRVRCKIPSRWS